MKSKEVVIRRPLFGSVLLFILCAIFVFEGIIMQQDKDTITRFWGIICIIFFGGGGLCYMVFMARKPIAVISNKEIRVPYGWGEQVVSWENVDRFEVIEQIVKSAGHRQKMKYIGIFVKDKEGIAGTGETSKAVAQYVTGWDDVPGLLINLSFSFTKIEKVMGILQEFYDEYKNAQ